MSSVFYPAIVLVLVVLFALLAVSNCHDKSDSTDADDDDDPQGEDWEPNQNSYEKYTLFSFGPPLEFERQFVPEFNEMQCPPMQTCEPNIRPTVQDALFSVNDELVSDFTNVQPQDQLRIMVPYADHDCNLACGAVYSSYDSPASSGLGGDSLPSNMPCDTEQSNVYVGFYFLANSEGNYTYMIQLADVCTEESGRVEGTFTISFSE